MSKQAPGEDGKKDGEAKYETEEFGERSDWGSGRDTRGPFLESPGNLTGPKSAYCSLRNETKRNETQQNQTKPSETNKTKPTKPNQTKRNQQHETKRNGTKKNETKRNQTKTRWKKVKHNLSCYFVIDCRFKTISYSSASHREIK